MKKSLVEPRLLGAFLIFLVLSIISFAMLKLTAWPGAKLCVQICICIEVGVGILYHLLRFMNVYDDDPT